MRNDASVPAVSICIDQPSDANEMSTEVDSTVTVDLRLMATRFVLMRCRLPEGSVMPESFRTPIQGNSASEAKSNDSQADENGGEARSLVDDVHRHMVVFLLINAAIEEPLTKRRSDRVQANGPGPPRSLVGTLKSRSKEDAPAASVAKATCSFV